MPFAIHMDIFDPAEATVKKRPFELAWSVHQASVEQMEAGIRLLEILTKKLREEKERRERGGDVDHQTQSGEGDSPEG
jgi:hypothetical protein